MKSMEGLHQSHTTWVGIIDLKPAAQTYSFKNKRRSFIVKTGTDENVPASLKSLIPTHVIWDRCSAILLISWQLPCTICAVTDLSSANCDNVLTQLMHPFTKVVNLCWLKGVQLVRPWNNIEHRVKWSFASQWKAESASVDAD